MALKTIAQITADSDTSTKKLSYYLLCICNFNMNNFVTSRINDLRYTKIVNFLTIKSLFNN